MATQQPKRFMCVDGNHAATYVAYGMSEMAFIYPITPASTMGEAADDWAAENRKNMNGNVVSITQLQSEGGAAGSLHGAVLSGALCSTFTCSQGLLLMIPELFKIAGELQPAVFHVATRTVGNQAMTIYTDHSDIMACRATGCAMLGACSVQEVMDLSTVSHLTTIQARTPFINFFDGFRVSHEVAKIEPIEYSDMKALYDNAALEKWREECTMRNDRPTMRALVDDNSVYFQLIEAANPVSERIPALVQANMDRIARLTGRHYHLFDYVGAPDARDVIVLMGSSCPPAEEYINHMVSQGAKIGLIKVRLFRPFSATHLAAAIPSTCANICVLDRTKEQGSIGEPLYLDVLAALNQTGRLGSIRVIAGRYGMGGKDFTPAMTKAVFDNISAGPAGKQRFVVGINDDVTHLSLTVGPNPVPAPAGMVQSLFFGFGADGTVGSVKNTINIIADNTPLYAQGFFAYDAKKSGGVTISHLRFSPAPITAAYEILEADYVACHHPSYIRKYDMITTIKEGGVFVINTQFSSIEDLTTHLPGLMKRTIARKNIKFYVIDADAIAAQAGLRGRINNVMQTVYFKLSNVLPLEAAIALLKQAIVHTYQKKGDDVVQKNFACVDATIAALHPVNVPATWADAPLDAPVFPDNCPEFYKNIAAPVLALRGSELPTSAFVPLVGGALPTDTAKFEKRGVAQQVPRWNASLCISCNFCSMVCPHATIRPFLLTAEEKARAPRPEHFATIPAKQKPYEFRIQVSPLDCMGCEACVNTCPKKALTMVDTPIRIEEDKDNWIFCTERIPDRSNEIFDPNTATPANVQTVQFRQPLLEFSAACAGCAETPIAKLLTQLYGERLMVANACGCSMVWGGNLPTCPYALNSEGRGPSYTGSLFEDNAELALGIALGSQHRRALLAKTAQQALELPEVTPDLRTAIGDWLKSFQDPAASKTSGMALRRLLDSQAARAHPLLQDLWTGRDLYQVKSYWAVGGDGWAYDIDFGGLDQVLNMGHKVNVLVLDTEVYSNTGGQKSKGTPRGAVARFAAGGKEGKKKDLGLYAVNIGSCYVASCCLGANMGQLLKALVEADRFPGTSIVICYCPCINHGLKQGQGAVVQEQKLAVQTGYWPLYRFNPLLKKEGKNPFQLDFSPATYTPLSEFLKSEVRFSSLIQNKPEVAARLHAQLQADLDEKNATLRAMAAAPAPAPAPQ